MSTSEGMIESSGNFEPLDKRKESPSGSHMDDLDDFYGFPRVESKGKLDKDVESALSPKPNDSDNSGPLNDESVSLLENHVSPLTWSGVNDVDTVQVDTPDNEFSKEAEEEEKNQKEQKTQSKSPDERMPTEIMDPDILTNYDQLFINTKYFLIKSNNYENVDLAKEKSAWSTPISNETRLNKAFHDSNNVILVFSVRESGKFQGFARLASPPDPSLKIKWILPPRMSLDMLSHPFRLDWITKQELPFSSVSHLTNAWNEGKPVKIGRDGQEIEPVCGQALCRHFPLDSVDALAEIVLKIEPKKPKHGSSGTSSSSTQRRFPNERSSATRSQGGGTSSSYHSRRTKDLGFHNPNPVGLLGAATTTRSTVPPLMSSLGLPPIGIPSIGNLAEVTHLNPSRGSLLPTADLPQLLPNNPGFIPSLVPGGDSAAAAAALSALLTSHAPAINRIFQQDSTGGDSSPPRSRRDRSLSGDSRRRGRGEDDYRGERRRYDDDDDYHRRGRERGEYRSRRSRETSRDRHRRDFGGRRDYRSRERSLSPVRAPDFIHWDYEDYLKEVQRGLNPNLNSLIDRNAQLTLHGRTDADREYDERVNAFIWNMGGLPGQAPPPLSASRPIDYRGGGYRDRSPVSRSSSYSDDDEDRHHRRRRSRRGRSRGRRYDDDEDYRRRYYDRRSRSREADGFREHIRYRR